MLYTSNSPRYPAGIPVGIIMMEAQVPYPPGSPNNARTFPFPVTYELIENATYDSLIYAPEFEALRDSFLSAGDELVRRGVKAVVGGCGFMVLFQYELAAHLPVPVYSSSLLQMPMIAQTIAPGKQIGILTFSGTSLTEEHMRIATAGLPLNYVIHGLENRPAFHSAVHAESGVLDFEAVEADIVAEALEMQRQNPNLGAILLECTDLPPYAAAVREATGLPVYDINSLIRWAQGSVEPVRYPHHR